MPCNKGYRNRGSAICVVFCPIHSYDYFFAASNHFRKLTVSIGKQADSNHDLKAHQGDDIHSRGFALPLKMPNDFNADEFLRTTSSFSNGKFGCGDAASL